MKLTKTIRSAAPLALGLLTFLAVTLLAPPTTLSAEPRIPQLTIQAKFPSGEPVPPELSSRAALLMDADTGEVLFAKEPDKRLPMASTTKIMTAIVVLESMDLDAKVVVSRNAHFQSGSVVGLHALDTFTVDRLLHWLLIHSGNDAAVALAEKASGSVSKFVAKMNEKAEAMGLTNTHFTNPNGLDRTGHYSSCADLATMARYAMQNETFRTIVATPTYDLPHPNSYTPEEPENSNTLLAKYDWITGIKTGSTPTADYCMVASGTRDGISLIAVQLGAKDNETRWAEVEALFRYGFSLSPAVVVAQPGQTLAEIPIDDPLEQTVELEPKDRLVARLHEDEVATGTITLSRTLELPIAAGDDLGSVQFTLDGRSLGETGLIARRAVHIPTVRCMIVEARNWYLPTFQLSQRGDRYPH